jgi:hypothetical protein
MSETDSTPDRASDKVDDHIATACITLVAGFVIFLTIRPPDNRFIVFAGIISISSLVLSFLCLLWYKIRHPVRQRLFERERRKIIESTSDRIMAFHELFIAPNPTAREELMRGRLEGITQDGSVVKMAAGPHTQEFHEIIFAHLKVLDYRAQELYETLYSRPLEEPRARVKLWLDSTARSLRYYSFLIGLFAFLVAVVLAALNSPRP